MKALAFLVCLLFAAQAQANTPVSITKFKSKVDSVSCNHHWDWWRDHLGDAFKEMLADELVKSGKVELYERETIKDIYSDEHELVNSDEDVSLKKGKFKKAKYTFVGAVTEYEFCADKKGGSVNVGGLASLFGTPVPDFEIGLAKATAKIAVDIRLIDTETGRVVKTAKGTGIREMNDFNVGTEVLDYSSASNTPMGEASREAIAQAAKELVRNL
jgi:curli biogenesis system outer membrane secretion channel CsgG